jgi:choline-sulfatase
VVRGSCFVVRFLFLLIAFLLTFTGTAQRRGPDLILITLDTVRADRIGTYGYKAAATPNLDRLASEGVRFDDATAHAPLTAPSHASILTGLYPSRLGVRDNAAAPLPDSAMTLAETLRDAGFRTGAFVGAFVLDRAYGFSQGFETFDADFGRFESGLKQQAQRSARAVVERAIHWLEQTPASQRVFLWVHLYDPHTPYAPPPQYLRRFARSPYDGEIAYVDTWLGRLFEALRTTDRYDGSVVSVIADHGESLGEHGEDEHGFFIYDAVLRIPWILKLPAAKSPVVVREQTRAVDLVPTVLDLLGVRAPEELDGESLVPVIEGKARATVPASYAESLYPRLHFGWSELRAVRDGEWKFIDAPRPELYALRADWREQRNIAPERERLVAGLRAELARIRRNEVDAPGVQPDAETLERLRSLGYVGLTAPATGRGEDPKDHVDDFRVFRRSIDAAIDHLRARRPKAAIAALKSALAINPKAFDLHLFLGDAYLQAGDTESALGEYAAAAVLYPNAAAPHLSSARALLTAGRADAALKKVEDAARVEPLSHEVPLARGLVYRAKGDLTRAQAELTRAVELNGRDPRARAPLADVSLRNGDLKTAKEQFEVLKEMEYQPARSEFGLGRVAELEGRKADAIRHYSAALKLDRSLNDAREGLERLR